MSETVEKVNIYVDNAATTAVYPEVFESMKPYFTEIYGNPSSIYNFAGKAKKAVDESREQIAGFLGAKSNEIYFTGGGSESDNWALKAAAEAFSDRGRHIIISKIEHHAILHTCDYLEKHGYEVTYLDVDENGKVNPADLEKAIRKDTILISIMFANNEIGTIQDIKAISTIAKNHGIVFHTDAVQAYGQIRINVEELGIDMLSASGHKIHGPKGIGILYISNKIKVGAFVHGGAQERGRRAGTHNVPGIVGMAKATEIADERLEKNAEYMTSLREHLIKRVFDEIPYVRLNGDLSDRLPNNVNFSIRFVEGESLLIMLDAKGICASSGSACTSGSLDPSHVLLAIGLPHEIAHGSLRITISPETTIENIDYIVNELKQIVKRLRDMSPLYEDFIRQQNHV